jgi:hypothetical protein
MTPFLQLAFLIAMILLTAKLGGFLSTRLGQPAVLGELIIGLILGPSLLNLIHLPFLDTHLMQEIIYQFAELGVLVLMFLAGLELHFSDLARNRRVSALAGSLGVAIPVGLGLLVGELLGYDFKHSAFLGLTLGATSVSISVQTLMELKVLRSRVGLSLLGAAVFDDILVILLLSIFLAFTSGAAGFLQNEDPLAGTPIRLIDGMIPGTPATISMIGLDLSVFGNSTGSRFYADDGQWWNTAGIMGSTTENKVLIAQLTTTGTLTFKLNFTLIKPDGISTELYIHSWPRSGATLCEKCTFNGVITSIADLKLKSESTKFRVFPNPVQNVLNVEVLQIEDVSYSYSIYNIIGNKMMESTSIPASQRFIRDIDISSFPKGAYIIRLVSKGGLNSARLFIKN